MDCEKYEPLLIDELYDELDEVTSAAVKRHVAGCSRCAAALNGLRGARRVAALPLVEIPDGLEDRILASVREAHAKVAPVVPLQTRFQKFLSVAGSWAMRPQTAMAAVFLLMIGTSAFVIRSRHGADASPQAVSVTEQGSPAATATALAEQDSLDNKAAAAAHGPHQPAPVTIPPVAAAPSASSKNGALAFGDPAATAGPVDGLSAGKGRGSRDDDVGALGAALAAAAGDAPKEEAARDKSDRRSADPSAKDTESEKKTVAANAPAGRSRASDMANAGPVGGAPAPDFASQQATPPATKSQSAGSDPQDGFSAGMAAYRARNFAEATKQFDAAARSGDQNSALWAAKSVKDGNGGCVPAVPRFDAVSAKAGASFVGHEAQLEAARCQITLGRLDNARERLAKLQTVPSHSAQAQQVLAELNQVAQRQEAERAKRSGGSGGGGAARAAPAPVRAPAKPSDAAGF